MTRDGERPDGDLPEHDAPARKRVEELWGGLIDRSSRSGMTLGRIDAESGASASSWRETLPSSTFRESEPTEIIVPPSPSSGDLLAGSTLDGMPKEPAIDPLVGGTLDGMPKDPEGDLLAGGTLDGLPSRPASTSSPEEASGEKPPAKPPQIDTASGLTLLSDGESDLGPALKLTPPTHEFNIEGRVASGGMGDVFLARQVGLDRLVAVKRPHEDMISTEAKLAAFVREGTVTGKLAHPGIVPIYQNGVDSNGRPFYAMKLIEGVEWRFLLHPDLAAGRGNAASAEALAKKSQSMTLEDHIEVFLRLCDAVAFAHSRHVIHRDLKPENVMVGDYGEVQLMDWGLALEIDPGCPQEDNSIQNTLLTGPGGTPAYMAPEMALVQGDRVGIGTDIYLLGGILYELLTGSAPHEAPDVVNALFLAATNKVMHPQKRKPEAPLGLSTIAMKALSTLPEDRHESVSALQDEIREYLRHSQSVRVAELAVRELEALDEKAGTPGGHGTSYIGYAEVVASFRQALEMWEDNSVAHDGLGRALTSFVRAAMEGGDLGLARAQLNELECLASSDKECTDELADAWARLDTKHRRRRQYFGITVGAAILMLLALVVGGLLSYLSIREERDAAERERLRAEQNLTLAEMRRQEAEAQRKEADQQRQTANTERSRAEKNFELAEQRRGEAEEERSRAESNYDLAEQRRRESERRRLQALRNLAGVDIQRARGRIDADRDYPEAALYLLRAVKTMGDADTVELRRLLAQLLQSSPLLEKTIELPSTGRGMRFLGTGLEGMRVLMEDGRMWQAAGKIEGETSHEHARSFAMWNQKWIVADRGGRIYADGEVLELPQLGRAAAACIASDEGGRQLAVGTRDGRLAVFDSDGADGLRFSVVAHSIGTLRAAFIPGSDHIASVGADGRLAVWNSADGSLESQVRAHTGFVNSLAVRADGELIATGGAEGEVRIWVAKDLSERASFAGHRREVGALSFHPAKTWVASQCWDGTVRLWDYSLAGDSKMAMLHVSCDGGALGLAFSADGRHLACLAGKRRVQLWDVSDRSDATPEAWRNVSARSGRILAAAGASVVVACGDATHHLQIEGKSTSSPASSRVLALLGRNRQFIVNSNGNVLKRDSNDVVVRLGTRVIDASQSDSFVALGTDAGDILLSRIDAEPPEFRKVASLKGLRGLAIAGDGKLLAAWDSAGLLRVGPPGKTEPVGVAIGDIQDASWVPGANKLAIRGKTRRMTVLDADKGKVVAQLSGHSAMVMALAMGSGGRWMASGGADGEIRIWDLGDYSSSVLVSGLGQWVEDVAIDDERGWVVCVLDDGTVRRFTLPEPDMDSDVAALERIVKSKLGIDRLPGEDEGKAAKR